MREGCGRNVFRELKRLQIELQAETFEFKGSQTNVPDESMLQQWKAGNKRNTRCAETARDHSPLLGLLTAPASKSALWIGFTVSLNSSAWPLLS